MTAALVVFVATYLIISSRIFAVLGLDRPAGALVGAVAMVAVAMVAVAMVAVGALAFDDAMQAIDLPR